MEIYLIFFSYIAVFSLGYILARLDTPKPINVNIQNPILPNFNTAEKSATYINKPSTETINTSHSSLRKIEIDDRKFITEVKTDSLEKKFDDLGKTTLAKDEALSANVSKLASLKKSKED